MSINTRASANDNAGLFYAVSHPFRSMKRVLPRGLFGRSLIIIVAPVVLLQAIVTYIFFERHYDIVTGRLSAGVARDVSYLVRLERMPPSPERDRLRELAISTLGYTVETHPGETLAQSNSDRKSTRLNSSH